MKIQAFTGMRRGCGRGVAAMLIAMLLLAALPAARVFRAAGLGDHIDWRGSAGWNPHLRYGRQRDISRYDYV